MELQDLPDELLPLKSRCHTDTTEGGDMIDVIQSKILQNLNKYIENLSPEVYVLLKDDEYYFPIIEHTIDTCNIEFFDKLYKLDYKFDVNVGLNKSAYRGHKDLVKFFINRGADDWNSGMNYAAKGGYIMCPFMYCTVSKKFNEILNSIKLKVISSYISPFLKILNITNLFGIKLSIMEI